MTDHCVPLFCIVCDRDCTTDPYRLTRNDGTFDGPACATCARDLNGGTQ